MNNNKMAEVAKLFNKNLSEEFNLKIEYQWQKYGIVKAKFTPLGLKVKTIYNAWELRNKYLTELLTGQAKIMGD